MALPLEEQIMREIGLGNHYNWYNGSGSCEYVRQKAIEQLTQAIQSYADAGEEILPPDRELIEFARQVAFHGEESQYSLTKTWEVVSYVIADHIHRFHDPDAKSIVDALREHYPLKRRDDIFWDKWGVHHDLW
jgi:hypothetical protein